MTGDSEKYWYNLTTGEVEKGFESPRSIGPDPSTLRRRRPRRLQILRERSRAWAEDDARDDDWGSSRDRRERPIGWP